MNFDLHDNSVLVTGSSRGIGKEIAREFLKCGATVVINGFNRESLEKTLNELNLEKKYGICADVTKPLEAKKLIEKSAKILNKINTIVCNVGSGRSVPPGHEDYEEWQRVFNQNLWSTTNIVEAGKKYLKKTQGSFICISSICGHEVIDNAPITYSTAKAALNFYIKSISRPLGIDNIRINAISPGNIIFKGSVWEDKLKKEPTLVRSILKDVPLSKLGSPQDISNLCIWLSSKKSSFCTGSIFKVDGGQLRG